MKQPFSIHSDIQNSNNARVPLVTLSTDCVGNNSIIKITQTTHSMSQCTWSDLPGPLPIFLPGRSLGTRLQWHCSVIPRPVSLAYITLYIWYYIYISMDEWFLCIPSLKPSQICKYGKLSHAFLAHVGIQPVLTLEINRLSCLSGSMLALDCSNT